MSQRYAPNSEPGDELGTDSACDFDNESDNDDGEQNFTSPTLFEKLHTRSTGACGTARAGLPKFEDKPGKGQQVYQSKDNMLALKWFDKREVIMLYTIHEARIEFTGKNDPKTKRSIQKLIPVIEYNSNRGAIDKVDMQTSFVECVRKSVK
ncbi:unnamed protein product [Didymodactylos carnosus]|uniref:PiggyBac transposable element-derived protein domain-containing protein n=1 Tax=Didymodactylos carnosus TaxID=1234261 RepID=A0A815U206_9BILA|nr:unnamed protein product [Didymodactylos carnosus]CAF4370736.1 unnamed protein product [Didymodactylos carnosus]